MLGEQKPPLRADDLREWMRRLRNQMVHEYIEDLAVLASALRGGHEFVPSLAFTAQQCVAKVEKILKHDGL